MAEEGVVMHHVESMPERVSAFLSFSEPARGAAVCIEYTPMAGGYSRVMAKATVEWSDGTVETVVLRGDPPEGQALIETDRDTEWLVHRALTEMGAVNMPAARYYDHTGEHLGTKCIVMDFVPGQSFQEHVEDRDDHHDQAVALADQLAQIHCVPVDELPHAMERPHPDTVIDGLIELWRMVSENHVNTNPVYHYVISWLERNKPAPMANTLVHGDFQNPNIMVDHAGSRAMIDWEFAHIGDPREDLGWYNLYSSVAGTNIYEANPEGFLERYRELTGFSEADVNQLTVGYFTIVGAAKVAVEILAAIDGLARDEVASTMAAHSAVGAITMGNTVYLDAIPALDQAMRAIRQGGQA